MANTVPYLDKSELFAWLRIRMKRDRRLASACSSSKRVDRAALLQELTDELMETFKPQRHGIDRAHVEHVVLQYIDPLHLLRHPSHLVHYPTYDPNLHHPGRNLLEVPDRVLAIPGRYPELGDNAIR